MRFRLPALPALTLATALLLVLPLLAAPPAQADFTGYAWQTTRIYSPATGNFAAADTALVRRPDGSFVELTITQSANQALPSRVIAWSGDGASWGAMEFPDGAGEGAVPFDLEAFAAPDGSVVAVWYLPIGGVDVALRTSTRSLAGVWSPPTDLWTGDVGDLRRLFPGPAGGTVVWQDDDADVIRSRTWSGGSWAAAKIGPGGDELPRYWADYGTAVRASDGQISVAYKAADGDHLRLAQLDPGGDWTTVTTHQIYTNCEVDVGVLDANGNIAATVTLCYRNEVTGMAGATYDPEGDLHLWWNNRYGMSYVDGLYPNYTIRCYCEQGVGGMVVADDDLDGRAFETVLPGLPKLPDGRSIHQVWDADGDRTVFVGGQGEYGRTINYYREGRTFANPNGSFQAPGTTTSSRSGFVSATFVSGDDILVGYQHSAPASNIGPGGSCNTRVLGGDGVLSDFLNACFDGNTRHWSALQAPDGSVYLGSSVARYVEFRKWVPADTPPPVAAAVGVTWPALAAGAPAAVGVTVTAVGTGQAATGTVRLRYDGTPVDTRTLAGGAATLTLPSGVVTSGSHTLRVEYDGSGAVLAGFAQTTVTVPQVVPPAPVPPTVKVPPRTPTVKVKKAPTPRKKGKAVVRVPPSTGLPVPGGRVTVTLTKGAKSKQATGTLAAGAVTVTLPRLAKGKWRLSAAYAGDATYLPAVSATVKVKVTR
ncbi:Ig-like domain-containing protein [Nocardioides humi]|uniref:Bacterial Ig-like domain-containing protein n=1 Tax=Nocardioides humi TaxID=449461 RepID=A0ABN2AMB0_9ACTN|nr:Ig-like domain-containing protein [Nocardioides humi]